MRKKIAIDRDTLYREAWQTPMRSLAQRYSISDVALAKVCRKLKVPTPPRGYWARIGSGQRITRPKLPELRAGATQNAMITPRRDRLRPLAEEVQQQKKFEADPIIEYPRIISVSGFIL
jgi:hypothetical protein